MLDPPRARVVTAAGASAISRHGLGQSDADPHAAIGLYEREGFRPNSPFGESKGDPLSRFYEKRIL